MRADHAELVVGRDLDGHVEEAAAHLFRLAVEFKGHVGLRISRHDGEAADEREMAVGVRGLKVFGIHVAKPGGGEPLFEVLEPLRRTHLADAENVGVDLLDHADERCDGRFRLGLRRRPSASCDRAGPDIVFDVIAGDDHALGLGRGQRRQAEEECQS